MISTHDMNFRADGDVTAEFQQNAENGNSCLTITSARQGTQIILTREQAAVVAAAFGPCTEEAEPDMDDRAETVTAPAPKAPKTKAAKKKAATKKAAKPAKKKAAKKKRKGSWGS